MRAREAAERQGSVNAGHHQNVRTEVLERWFAPVQDVSSQGRRATGDRIETLKSFLSRTFPCLVAGPYRRGGQGRRRSPCGAGRATFTGHDRAAAGPESNTVGATPVRNDGPKGSRSPRSGSSSGACARKLDGSKGTNDSRDRGLGWTTSGTTKASGGTRTTT